MFKWNSIAKILGGTVIGVGAATIHNYHKPYAVIEHAKNDPEWGIEVVKKMAENDPVLSDAVAVITTQSATQFGKEFHNKLTNEGRKSIIAHPYDKQGSGVSVTVSYVTKDGSRKVLMMRKLKVRNKPDEGLKPRYDPIGGYTKGAGVEGSKMIEESFAAEENRDAIEDAFSETGKYQKDISSTHKEEKSIIVNKEYFNKIASAMDEYFREQLKQNPYFKKPDPIEVKKYLKEKKIFYTRDFNTLDTAIREFLEETGYNGEIKDAKMFEIVNSIGEYGINNVPNLHTVADNIVVDLGILDEEPVIYDLNYKGKREANSFQANGTEIGNLQWVSFKDLATKDDGITCYNNIEVEKAYGSIMQNVARYLHDKELNQASNGLIPSKETINSWAARVRHDNKASKLGEFGQEAWKQHENDKCFANAIKHFTNLSDQIIFTIFENCQKQSR